MSAPVVTLPANFFCQIEQPALACAIVEPVDAQHQIAPAESTPFEKWLFIYVLGQVAAKAGHDLEAALVPRSFVILGQRF